MPLQFASINHPACLSDEALLKQCTVEHLRRSGPGGQHRNKVATGIRLLHRPTGIAAQATERRIQTQNLSMATSRLRWELILMVRRPYLADECPSPLWKSRCRDGQIIVAARHDDFPFLVVEALDLLAHFEWEISPAAEILKCSSSQLLKLLKKEPRILTYVNREREQRGLHPMH